jgi:hypothetical protein
MRNGGQRGMVERGVPDVRLFFEKVSSLAEQRPRRSQRGPAHPVVEVRDVGRRVPVDEPLVCRRSADHRVDDGRETWLPPTTRAGTSCPGADDR